jgi:replicative DNA helicase
MGKTTLALNILDRIAVNSKKAVALFSLEMSAQQIARNMLCSHARVDAHKLRTGYLESERYSDLSMAVGVLSEAKIFIDDSMGLTPFQVKARARRLKAKHDISLVVIDYLQLLDAPRAENRQQEISIISRQLKALAKELNIPVIAVSQLSRAVESREGNRPRLSDLRESGAIEQDADLVMLLFREDYYITDESKHSNVAELNVAKQRNGPTGMVKLHFARKHLRFESLSVDRGAEFYAEETAAFEG